MSASNNKRLRASTEDNAPSGMRYIDPESVPRPEYPRPDWFRPGGNPDRPDWFPLNGQWDFAYDDEDRGIREQWYINTSPSGQEAFRGKEITVPFAFQTEASGIGQRAHHEILWYATVVGASPVRGPQHFIHFGAVDYECDVWVSGQHVASHRGGQVPFKADITVQNDEADRDGQPLSVVVRVCDRLQDLTQPRGKQYWRPKSESIFYTPCSGIHQSVWLEQVPKLRIDDAVLVPDIDNGILSIDATLHGFDRLTNHSITAKATLGGIQVASATKKLQPGASRASLSLDMTLTGYATPEDIVAAILSNMEQQSSSSSTASTSIVPDTISGETFFNGIALWTPERPALYDIELSLTDYSVFPPATVDRVLTYAGMRKVSVEDGLFKLNNRPYFQRLVLDQGLWPRTGFTAPSDQAFKEDILKMKSLGFNGARKHQKVEDPRYLYWADRLGFLVWAEIGNAYEWTRGMTERFIDEWGQAVKRDVNHPCIVAWTPVNESWSVNALATDEAQRDFLQTLYHLTRTIDPQRRPVVDNDGWEHVKTDLMTVHDYADGEGLRKTCESVEGLMAPKAGKDVVVRGCEKYTGRQPIILSEFGGVNIVTGEAAANRAGGSEDWGYHTARSAEDLEGRLKALIDAIIDGGIVQGFCYTQLADCEQETNGVLTADRQYKLDPEKCRAIFGRKSRWEL